MRTNQRTVSVLIKRVVMVIVVLEAIAFATLIVFFYFAQLLTGGWEGGYLLWETSVLFFVLGAIWALGYAAARSRDKPYAVGSAGMRLLTMALASFTLLGVQVAIWMLLPSSVVLLLWAVLRRHRC